MGMRFLRGLAAGLLLLQATAHAARNTWMGKPITAKKASWLIHAAGQNSAWGPITPVAGA